MADRLDRLDYYALLGVKPKDPPEAVRAAFHRFALKYHPDNHAEPKKKARANEVFRRGAEAYRVLRDQELRNEYDAVLARGQLRLRSVPAESERRRRSTLRRSIRHPKARPLYAKAVRALKDGDEAGAKLSLQIALRHEPDSEVLNELLRKIEERAADRSGSGSEGGSA